MLQEELNKIWSDWKIEKTLGEGAFGKVYKISKEEYGHVYESALKVITIPQNQSEITSVMSDGLDEKSATLYFDNIVSDIVKEIILMNDLKGNTNIVSYEDHKVIKHEEGIGWTIYIRMELLTPLYDYVKNNPPTLLDGIKLGIDICNALEVCQYDHIIHRDIKPENIFVSKNGNYKLGDFGIARQMEKNNVGLSKKGTFTYMAPEVYKGESYNENVDLYSLGIVLYRFLNNNRTPFLPAYPAMITPVDRERANIKRLNGCAIERPCNGTDEFINIVLKACAYNPEERYKSASEMKADLEKALEEIENLYVTSESDTDESITDEAVVEEKKLTTVIEQVEEEELTIVTGKRDEVSVSMKKESPDTIDEKKHNNSKSKIIIAAIAAVFVVVGCAIAFKGSGKITVPDLTNMNLEQIEAADYDFTVVEKGTEFSDVVEKDCIISQSIEEGTKVKEGTEIEVIISKGKAVKVPDFVGMTIEDAKKVAEELIIILKVEQEFSEDVAEGEIISQNVSEGTELAEGEEVTVVVSKGVEEELEEQEETESTYVPKKQYAPKKPAKDDNDSDDESDSDEGDTAVDPVPGEDDSTDTEPVPGEDSGTDPETENPGADSGTEPEADSGTDSGTNAIPDSGADAASDIAE